jgi:hypothetical protein
VYVFFIAALINRGSPATIGFAIFIFGPIWTFVSLFAIRNGRIKVMFGYPLIILFLPIFASIFQVYGMMTFRVRSWGGPRAAVVAQSAPVGEKAAKESDRQAQIAEAL